MGTFAVLLKASHSPAALPLQVRSDSESFDILTVASADGHRRMATISLYASDLELERNVNRCARGEKHFTKSLFWLKNSRVWYVQVPIEVPNPVFLLELVTYAKVHTSSRWFHANSLK